MAEDPGVRESMRAQDGAFQQLVLMLLSDHQVVVAKACDTLVLLAGDGEAASRLERAAVVRALHTLMLHDSVRMQLCGLRVRFAAIFTCVHPAYQGCLLVARVLCGQSVIWTRKTRACQYFCYNRCTKRHRENVIVYIPVGPLIIESPWAEKQVSTGALEALDDPSAVKTKYRKYN